MLKSVNIICIKGHSITVDIKEDILKEQPYLTLGSSTQELWEMTLQQDCIVAF